MFLLPFSTIKFLYMRYWGPNFPYVLLAWIEICSFLEQLLKFMLLKIQIKKFVHFFFFHNRSNVLALYPLIEG